MSASWGDPYPQQDSLDLMLGAGNHIRRGWGLPDMWTVACADTGLRGSSPNTQPLPRSPPFLAGMGLEGAGLEETGLSLRAGSWIFLLCPDVS